MIRTASIAGLVLMAVFALMSFLPGTGTRSLDSRFATDPLDTTHSYFKTPQSASRRILAMSSGADLEELSRFLESTDTDPINGGMRSGSFRFSTTGSTINGKPVLPDLSFIEAIRTEHSDVYEIALGRFTEDGVPIVEGVLYLKRYPEGYRILADRPG